MFREADWNHMGAHAVATIAHSRHKLKWIFHCSCSTFCFHSAWSDRLMIFNRRVSPLFCSPDMNKLVLAHLWLSSQPDEPCVSLSLELLKPRWKQWLCLIAVISLQDKRNTLYSPAYPGWALRKWRMHATASVTHVTFKGKTSYKKPLTHECPHTRSSSHLPLTCL